MGPVVADLEMQGLTVDKDPKMNIHITAFFHITAKVQLAILIQ